MEKQYAGGFTSAGTMEVPQTEMRQRDIQKRSPKRCMVWWHQPHQINIGQAYYLARKQGSMKPS